MTNYYEVLGVAQGSTPEEIRKSFRRRAKELHPDLSGDQSADSLEGMRLLLAAYSVLSDLEKRAEYDRAIGRKPARAQFDYREFLRGRVDDPYSQSKLIFHDLLTNHHDEALDLYERFTVVRGFPLERYLSREDYMDCAFPPGRAAGIARQAHRCLCPVHEAVPLGAGAPVLPPFHGGGRGQASHAALRQDAGNPAAACSHLVPGGADRPRFLPEGQRVLLQEAGRGPRRPGAAGDGIGIPAQGATIGSKAARG